MSLTVTNTQWPKASDSAQGILPSKEKTAAPKTEPTQEAKSTLGTDKVETTGKSGIVEGIKFQASRGALWGGIGGAVGLGAGTWGLGKIVGAFNGDKTIFGAFGPQGVAVMAGIGLAGGAIFGAIEGTVDGAVTGAIVDHAKNTTAAEGGTETEAQAKAVNIGKGVGAAAGALFSIKSLLISVSLFFPVWIIIIV